MLGFGGTDKPTDPSFYRATLIAKDIVDILNAEKIDKVIGVGHDWGAFILARLANVAPERFYAYAFFAVSYTLPDPNFNIQDALKFTKQHFGYELFGYWMALSEEGSEKLLEQHWDTCFGLIWPHDPELWKTHMAPLGVLKSTLLSDQRFPLPSYLTEDDKKTMSDVLLKGGMAGPVCYYKVRVNGQSSYDDSTIPKDRYIPPASSPIFFGAALKDYVCIAEAGKQTLTSPAFKDHKVTIRDFDADHWLILSVPDEINRELGAWIESVSATIPNAHL